MVKDVERLRAIVFERTGIAVDADDPLMAVLVASSSQAEEVGIRLLRRTNPLRVVIVSAATAVVFAAISSWATWQFAITEAAAERAEWLRQERDPRTAALLRSEQGRAALRLAELGVATMLANCSGRSTWKVTAGYCVPIRADGQPDGFNIAARAATIKR